MVRRRLRRRWSAEKFAAAWETRKGQGPVDGVSIAKACGLRSQTTLYAWKRGEGKPDVDQFWALVEALGVDESDLTELA